MSYSLLQRSFILHLILLSVSSLVQYISVYLCTSHSTTHLFTMANQTGRGQQGKLLSSERDDALGMNADVLLAQERLSQVSNHLSGVSSSKKGKQSVLEKNPDDVCFSLLTPRIRLWRAPPGLD